MESLKVVAVLLAIICAAHAHTGQERSLLKSASLSSSINAESTSGKGEAAGSLDIKAKDGPVKAFVEAFSANEERLKNDLKIIRRTLVKNVKGGKKKEVVVDETAKAIGVAVAEALTTVFIDVDSEAKDSTVCANAVAVSEARAKVVAVAVVEVLLDVKNDKAEAIAEGDGKSIAVGVAEAASEAHADVCLEGEGTAEVYQESYARSLVKAFATVTVDAYGKVKGDDAEASVQVDAESSVKEEVEVGAFGDVDIVGEGEATVDAVARANAFKQNLCKDSYAACCKRRLRVKGTCRCFGRKRCEMDVTKKEDILGDTYFTVREKGKKTGDEAHECHCKR